jgi:hypothetical protein
MKFKELIKNPYIIPTDELVDFLNIEKGKEIDFFQEIQKQIYIEEPDETPKNYIKYEHYVVLCNGILELFCNGIIEVRSYNFGIDIFKIVKMFDLQRIELEQI